MLNPFFVKICFFILLIFNVLFLIIKTIPRYIVLALVYFEIRYRETGKY